MQENCIIKRPEKPDFQKEGMDGYCYALKTENLSLTIEDSYKGHDKYCTNTKNDVIYYVLEGEGKFSIDGKIYEVKKDDVVEIKVNTEYVFAGKMKLLYISVPAYKNGDFINGRENDIW